jgi:hypothetical protein
MFSSYRFPAPSNNGRLPTMEGSTQSVAPSSSSKNSRTAAGTIAAIGLHRRQIVATAPRGERDIGPIKPGRCATHSEMPTAAVAGSGDRSRNA